MSERAPHGPEGLHHVEHAEKHEHQEHHRKHHETAEAAPHGDNKEKLETIRHQVEQEALTGKDVKVDTNSEHSAPSQQLITKELRYDMLQRTLTRVRKKLPAPSRQFSKFVHAKPVETISSVGEKTIARPVGIFGGGLAALIGSGFVLYMSREYGFKYNYLLFVLLFIGGYLLSTVIEFIMLASHRAKHGKR